MAHDYELLECHSMRTPVGYVCSVHLEGFKAIAAKTELGTSIVSNTFELDFPGSIGTSAWSLRIFPSGQYTATGKNNEYMSAYLKLISAENDKESLTVDVTFAVVRVSDDNQQRKIKSSLQGKNRRFCLSENKTAQWFGGKLCETYELDDSVRIKCHLRSGLHPKAALASPSEMTKPIDVCGASSKNELNCKEKLNEPENAGISSKEKLRKKGHEKNNLNDDNRLQQTQQERNVPQIRGWLSGLWNIFKTFFGF